MSTNCTGTFLTLSITRRTSWKKMAMNRMTNFCVVEVPNHMSVRGMKATAGVYRMKSIGGSRAASNTLYEPIRAARPVWPPPS
jgi:hypothetical protein